MPAADRFEQFVEGEEEEILHFVPKMNKKNFKANSLVKPLQPVWIIFIASVSEAISQKLVHLPVG